MGRRLIDPLNDRSGGKDVLDRLGDGRNELFHGPAIDLNRNDIGKAVDDDSRKAITFAVDESASTLGIVQMENVLAIKDRLVHSMRDERVIDQLG